MLKVLDLFSGIGGFSIGLERTGGFETVAFCEINPFCRQVLAKHWPGVPIHDDIQTLSADWLAEMGAWPDVICGGFPCQDLSYAGKGAGLAGERSGLWREYARLIGEIRPAFVIVENVAALLGRGLGDVLGDLAALGYDAEWHCIPASYVGAPHQRDRIWIVAYPASMFRDGSNDHTCCGGESSRASEAISKLGDGGCDQDLANTDIQGLEGWISAILHELAGKRPAGSRGPSAPTPTYGRDGSRDWWLIEPDVGRVAHGISSRVDRLKALGNAVVPQIPELIGRAILNTAVPSREDRASDPAVMPRSGVAAPFVKPAVPVCKSPSLGKEGDT